MIAYYFRIALMIVAFIAAALLFAFAFTAAAVVVLVLVIVGLIFGRRHSSGVWVFRRETTTPPQNSQIIDHDPNDLPPKA